MCRKLVQQEEGVKLAVAGAFGPSALTALEELGIGTLELSGVTVEEALREARERVPQG